MKPWMHDKEIEKIISYLQPQYKMYEWGCGGSTMSFSSYVSLYRSIEHDINWFNKLKKIIPQNSNIDLHYFSNKNNYQDYINSISTFDDKYDAILIDGRCRVKCAMKSTKHLNDGAIIFVHDYFCRKYYHSIGTHFKLIDSIKNTQQTLAVFRYDVHN